MKVAFDLNDEITTYTEGGRGRKQCPTCSNYVGVRNQICACGNNFKENPSVAAVTKDEPKEITTFETGGRGRKQCPSCKKFVGVRNFVCTCGHEFKKPKINVPELVTPTASKKEFLSPLKDTKPKFMNVNGILSFPGGNVRRTWAAAGEPPHKLTGTSKEAVTSWMNRCRKTYLDQNEWLTANALVHWVRMEYYCPFGNTEEFEAVRTIIIESSEPDDVDDP